MPETPRSLLDSYAILALLNDESGAEAVADLLRRAIAQGEAVLVNELNVGEVYSIVAKHRSIDDAERVLHYLDTLPLEIVSNEYEHVLDAAHVKASYPLSYADAFAVATAVRLHATVITGDAEFASVEELVEIRWI